MRIRLTRKLSNFLNDVDLRPFQVNDGIEVPAASAHMLIAEGWAEPLADARGTRAIAHDYHWQPLTRHRRISGR